MSGLYVYKENIFASVIGIIQKTANNAYFVLNKISVKCVDIKVGDIVYGQITKIREDEAFVSLIQIGDVSLGRVIEGTIRKEHVR